MAFSIQRAVSDGTMTLLPISIEYFDREEISVLFDGVLNARQWAWVGTTDKTLSFTPAVANNVEVMVVRSTDLSELRHQFSLGAQFTAESLDESLLQVLHIAQEATERQLGGDFFTDIDMHGSQIINLGAATAPDHAVTLAQYQADASGASAAKATAVASASTAVAASNSASASASAALLSANNADVSEFNALSSANSASTSASTASTKAAEAAASAAAALVSKNASALAESSAKASEVAAAASAASALHPWEAEAGGIHYDLGNVRIGGSGKRITGDLSNATIANRVMFQTSTGTFTDIGALGPNAAQSAGWTAYLGDDPTNTSRTRMLATSIDARFESGITGTGTYLPMTFYTGGSERMRIDTSGNVGIGTSSPGDRLTVSGGNQRIQKDVPELRFRSAGDVNRWYIGANISDAVNGGLYFGSGEGISSGTPRMVIDSSGNVGIGVPSPIYRTDVLSDANSYAANFRGRASDGLATLRFCLSDNTWTNQLESRNGSLSIISSGNVVMGTPNGGLGYGTGAGGTVTQATSKSTDVTLNKPTGRVTTHNAVLAAGASVTFNVLNSIVAATDAVVVSGAFVGGVNPAFYRIECCLVGAGYFSVRITNISGGSLSEAILINFAIIKGATL